MSDSLPQIYRGKVTRMTSAGAYVEIPSLGSGAEYGPCEFAGYPNITQPAGTGPHEHDINTIVLAGARVLVAVVAGVKDDLVIIGVLPPGGL